MTCDILHNILLNQAGVNNAHSNALVDKGGIDDIDSGDEEPKVL